MHSWTERQDIVDRLDGIIATVTLDGLSYDFQAVLDRMECDRADRVWERLQSDRFRSDIFGDLPPLPPPSLQDFVSAYARTYRLFLGDYP